MFRNLYNNIKLDPEDEEDEEEEGTSMPWNK